MVVKLKYYGTPVAGVDRNNLSMEIPAGSTVEGLLSVALGKTELPGAMSFLVNNTQASLKTTLNENDEVIALRPMNGG